MTKKIIITGFFILLSLGSWYAEQNLQFASLDQITNSAIAITFLYFIFEVLLNSFGAKQIRDAKSAYRFRKTVGVLFYLVLLLVLFRIWIEDPQALLVSYGIVAAGATIALQDLIKNFAGGIVIIVNNLFRVGDRIEVQDSVGDVIDIGLFNTTMLEIRNWVSGDQSTGRILTVPNGIFLSNRAINYTRDHEFIWDEFMIPVTHKSDWKKASRLLKETAKRKTKDSMDLADRQLKRLARKFYIAERETAPQVFINPTDNWIELHLRYITEARTRRLMKTTIAQSVLTSFSKQEEIEIASATIDIIGFPNQKKK